MTPEHPISVVIPAFQAAATIVEAVTSVLDQRPAPIEVIVVDDGSTDGTAAKLERFGRATVITQPNAGEAAARNTGLAAVRTEWVAFLDADDSFLPGRLAAITERIDADPSVDIVTTNAFLQIDGRIAGTAYGPRWPFAYDDQRREILRRNFVFGHVIARADDLRAAGGFDESISHTTDWALWLRLILDGKRVGLVPRPLSIYRLHAASASADRLAMATGGLASLRTATRHPGLLRSEREVLDVSIRRQVALVKREELSAAVVGNTPVIRRCALAVAGGREQPGRARAKAAVTAMAPRLVAAIVQRRRRHAPVGTLGRSVPEAPLATAVDTQPPLTTVVVSLGDDSNDLARSLAEVSAQHCQALEVLLALAPTTRAPVRADALGAARADPDRIRIVPAGGRLVSLARAPTIVVLAAGDDLEPAAVERRLQLLARCSEAGAVIDTRDDASPYSGEPLILAAGRYPRMVLAGRTALAPANAALFSRDALIELPVSSVGRELIAIGLRHPVVLQGSVPEGHLHVVDGALQRWVLRHAWRFGWRGWALAATVAVRCGARAISRRVATSRSRRVRDRPRDDVAAGDDRRASTPADRPW